MLTANDILERVTQRPFLPLRLVTSGGQSYDVYHPDLIMVGRRSITVGTASNDNPRQYEQTTRIAVLHVTALEDLPAQMPPTGENGHHAGPERQ
jgi:hypothetical protein